MLLVIVVNQISVIGGSENDDLFICRNSGFLSLSFGFFAIIAAWSVISLGWKSDQIYRNSVGMDDGRLFDTVSHVVVYRFCNMGSISH